jgi:hypothetical protein
MSGVIFHGTSIAIRKSVTTTKLTTFQISGNAGPMLKITNEGPSDIVYSIGTNLVSADKNSDGTHDNENILLLTGQTEYRLMPTTGQGWFTAVLAGAATSATVVQFELGKYVA